ncbi:MAG: hypothetical protein ACK5P5_14150 [Pseudobdellovibrionaceae bacterium]
MNSSQSDENIQHIESFQFENLVKNRIPFILLHFGQDFSEILTGFYATYAKTQGVDVSFIHREEPHSTFAKLTSRVVKVVRPEGITTREFLLVEEKLKERGLSKDSALVFLCESGKKSYCLFQHFWKRSYGNGYWVKDGMQGLRRGFRNES